MSKIFFTIALPHAGPGTSHTPQFYVSCNNNTHLSMKGLDLKSVKFSNSNVDPGYKNRFEFSVTASKSISRLTL